MGTVRAISAFLIPVLESLIGAFPFEVKGFHADRLYINRRVAKLLNKLHVGQFTKSRARHTNDNALVESKNASVIRKLGWHIPAHLAEPVNQFNPSGSRRFCITDRASFPPRRWTARAGCASATATPTFAVRSSLDDAERYLRPGIAFGRGGARDERELLNRARAICSL